jgi:hypothetical protein
MIEALSAPKLGVLFVQSPVFVSIRAIDKVGVRIKELLQIRCLAHLLDLYFAYDNGPLV